ncbi:IS1 family transposase [Piscirickettsia salmonis]
MTYIEVHCPQCNENDVIKFGRNASGNQRYKCKIQAAIKIYSC